MSRFLLLLCAIAVCVAPLCVYAGQDVPPNSSKAAGIPWIDEQELESEPQSDEAGFVSLDSMLQWAIGHSDPQILQNSAQETMELTHEELAKRRADIKELMERLQMPSDAELMKIAIDDLLNSSLPAEYRKRALDELLELVEPLDNANDLDKLGGLKAVIRELERPEEELRTAAAWVLGKASQNNRLVQNQILEHGALQVLMEMVLADSEEEAVKALYAVSGVIRNHPAGHEVFYKHGGSTLLQDLLRNSSTSKRLTRKCLFLIADLAEQLNEAGTSYVPQEELLKSVVQLLESSDLDTQEKALMAVKSLARIISAHDTLKSVCKLDNALEKLRISLEELMLQEEHAEFAKDMENLRQEVVRSV